MTNTGGQNKLLTNNKDHQINIAQEPMSKELFYPLNYIELKNKDLMKNMIHCLEKMFLL